MTKDRLLLMQCSINSIGDSSISSLVDLVLLTYYRRKQNVMYIN